MDKFNNDNNLNDENTNLNNNEYESFSDLTSEHQDVVSAESSYEWETDSDRSSSEYRHSYVNGNNQYASHNPNNYDSAYSTTQYDTGSQSGTYAQPNDSYTAQNGGSAYGYSQNPQTQDYSAYSNPQQTYQDSGVPTAEAQGKKKKTKQKREKKPASKGFVAAMVAAAIVLSSGAGFVGGYIANNTDLFGTSSTNSDGITINKVASSGVTNTASSGSSSNASEVVKKVADSVVEIATESVTTSQFAQQYVTQGAGSGVIISKDGYIITNYHVVDGASKITVTLRDGSTTYQANMIGGDEEQDIALLKVEANDLTPANFGDSANLAVGDYVVAIGNPLGELGGTVTDGIISALARQVTIENNNMTLLQTNAQISPGNSGGGLFNANGELIGITNAKDSATEVEGISFAIPINNVLNIIGDLKTNGYVTGKIDIGMQLTDVTSSSAYFYGMSSGGCYVTSVTRGSNAESAGFRPGDIITSVNGKEISSSDEVKTALKDNKVGDKVTFGVTRSGKSDELTLTLQEYKPSSSTANSSGSSKSSDFNW